MYGIDSSEHGNSTRYRACDTRVCGRLVHKLITMRYTYTYITKQRRSRGVMSTPCNHHSRGVQTTSIIDPYKINPCLLPHEGRGLVREGVASAISIPFPTFPSKSSFL